MVNQISYMSTMEEREPAEISGGEELIGVTGALAVTLARSMGQEELGTFCEVLGLLRHDLDIIRMRRFQRREQRREPKLPAP